MKTNDLRIGNWIADRGLKEWQIDHWETINKVSSKASTSMFMGIMMETHPLTEYVDYLRPIPLTEEWLLKFGAINSSRFWLLDKIELGHITTDDYYEFEWQTPLLDWEITPIKYVHTLQNLYWCLCGEELKIKLQ